MKYKKAESQGAYIDRLRVKYPFHILCNGYDAYLYGIQPLLDGQDVPIYRFPGGDKIQNPFGNEITIIEW